MRVGQGGSFRQTVLGNQVSTCGRRKPDADLMPYTSVSPIRTDDQNVRPRKPRKGSPKALGAAGVPGCDLEAQGDRRKKQTKGTSCESYDSARPDAPWGALAAREAGGRDKPSARPSASASPTVRSAFRARAV